MRTTLILPPASEPISLAEAKLYLRVEASDEDPLITTLITAARHLVEAASGRLLIGQTWRITLDAWPPLAGTGFRLPFAPVLAATAARVIDAGGAAVTVPLASLALDAAADPPTLRALAMPPATTRPVAGVEIDIRAGFGEAGADVPASLRQATLRLVGLWFDRRGDAVDGEPTRLPAEVMALIAPHRRGRL